LPKASEGKAMSYLLATTDARVRWYDVKIESAEDFLKLQPGDFSLKEELNLAIITGWGNKETAKRVAMAIGLKTWRYVKIDSTTRTFTFTFD
jgi:hypothetical protein